MLVAQDAEVGEGVGEVRRVRVAERHHEQDDVVLAELELQRRGQCEQRVAGMAADGLADGLG